MHQNARILVVPFAVDKIENLIEMAVDLLSYFVANFNVQVLDLIALVDHLFGSIEDVSYLQQPLHEFRVR